MAKPVAVRPGPSTSAALASNSACVITRTPLSSAIGAKVTGLVVGASFTATTVMATLSVSDIAPPAPLLPRSSVTMLNTAAPLKFAPGAKARPFSAALIDTRVPVKVRLALPSAPPVSVMPAVPPRVSTPFVTVSVTCSALLAASTSPTLIALPFAALNTSAVSSPTTCAAGTVFSGASLTAVTLMRAVSVAALNAVLPPFVEASSLLPAAPVLWSQARKVRLPAVPFCPSGTNRNRSLARSSSALLSDTAPTPAQLVAPSMEYCQVPPEVPLTAMPSSAPLSTSVMRSPPALAMIDATVLPALLIWSSSRVVSSIAPLLSSTGASLTAATLMLAVSVAVLKAVLPPFVEMSTRLPAAPLVWSQAR